MYQLLPNDTITKRQFGIAVIRFTHEENCIGIIDECEISRLEERRACIGCRALLHDDTDVRETRIRIGYNKALRWVIHVDRELICRRAPLNQQHI